MAIKPPSDIVLEVARAADPVKRQAAVDKLGGATGTEFASLVAHIEPAGTSNLREKLQAAPLSADGKSAVPEAYKSFEAFFLQSFIQSMLPKSSEATYGSGTAGDVWRSLAAQEMGDTIAKAGGVGIAERLAAQSPGSDSQFSIAGSLAEAPAFRNWADTLPFIGIQVRGSGNDA